MRHLLAALMLAISTSAMAAGSDYDVLFQKHGAAHAVDWRLLKAIATVESHLNPRAENADGLSAGIMQIYCDPHGRGSVAKGHDGMDTVGRAMPGAIAEEPVATAPNYTPSCHNRFDLPAWPPAKRADLYDPDYNIAIGAQIIAWNIEQLGLARGIAAYNQWSARRTPRGKLFPNQYYVDKVLYTYRQFQRETQ